MAKPMELLQDGDGLIYDFLRNYQSWMPCFLLHTLLPDTILASNTLYYFALS